MSLLVVSMGLVGIGIVAAVGYDVARFDRVEVFYIYPFGIVVAAVVAAGVAAGVDVGLVGVGILNGSSF